MTKTENPSAKPIAFRRDQKSFFDDNGFVVIPDVLNASELAELRKNIDAAMDGTIKPDRQPGLDDFHIQWEPSVKDKPDVARRDKIRVMFHLSHTHSYFWELATSKTMLDLVENLIGPDIKYYTDQMFCKPAKHGSEVPWHHDSAYWPDAEPGLLSCWLAIDDVTIQNGCVRFIPGSHKSYAPHHEIVTTNPNNITVQPGHADPAKEVPVEIKAGSMSVHHSLTLHRSLPNMSDRARRGLVMIYLPADLKFIRPWNFVYGFQQVRGRDPVASSTAR
jgi:ectoine hydroxylase-related dioxygenase (phytanoyl-CoA dioxygenase family)